MGKFYTNFQFLIGLYQLNSYICHHKRTMNLNA